MAYRIAIASSGLGHIRRGIESWAEDSARGLRRSGVDVTLFQGGGQTEDVWRRRLACCRRFEPTVSRLFAVTKKLGGWRYGMGSEYDIEQSTFSCSLWRAIRKDYDILHVQDPLVADRLHFLNRHGWSRPRVILAHGTEEPDSELRKFSYLQHLAPCYAEDWAERQPANQVSFAVPNFVDTSVFHPGDRQSARQLWNLPQDALIILCVAALKKNHKRCDYLIREFSEFRKRYSRPAALVMAGAREKETDEVLALGKSTLGNDLHVFESVERSKLPSLYQACDVFALASLWEMMPIASLEALASGLPITCNNTPVLQWIAGPAGSPVSIAEPGGLMRQWEKLVVEEERSRISREARSRAETMFSEAAVLAQMRDMYARVLLD